MAEKVMVVHGNMVEILNRELRDNWFVKSIVPFNEYVGGQTLVRGSWGAYVVLSNHESEDA